MTPETTPDKRNESTPTALGDSPKPDPESVPAEPISTANGSTDLLPNGQPTRITGVGHDIYTNGYETSGDPADPNLITWGY